MAKSGKTKLLRIKFGNNLYTGWVESGVKRVPPRLVRVANTKEEIIIDFRIRFNLSDDQVKKLQEQDKIWSITI